MGEPWLLGSGAHQESRQALYQIEKVLLLLVSIIVLLQALLYWRTGESLTAEHKSKGLFNTDLSELFSRVAAIFILAAPLVYLWFFARYAWLSFFLENQDFTNISSALNHTAQGRGLLRTGFLPGGPSGSYLGHHFAPALLLYVPLYSVLQYWPDLVQGLQPLPVAYSTHFPYALLLWLTLAAGLLIWRQLARRVLPGSEWALVFLGLMVLHPALMHLISSFHFELLVLPASGLFFGQLWTIHKKHRRGDPLRRHDRWLLFLYALAWLAIKEDIAVYLAFLALALSFGALGSALSASGRVLLLLCILYFVSVQGGLMQLAGGGSRATWQHYWLQESPVLLGNAVKPAIWLLLAMGGTSLLRLRFFALAILPILVLHLFSEHLMHRSYLGHYSYTILPVLFFGSLIGLRQVQRWQRSWSLSARHITISLVLLCGLWINHKDRIVPMPAFNPDQSARELAGCLRPIVAAYPRACVYTQSVLSPHLPLQWTALPLDVPTANYYPSGNPWTATDMSAYGTAEFRQHCPVVLLMGSTLRSDHHEWQSPLLPRLARLPATSCQFQEYTLFWRPLH